MMGLLHQCQRICEKDFPLLDLSTRQPVSQPTQFQIYQHDPLQSIQLLVILTKRTNHYQCHEFRSKRNFTFLKFTLTMESFQICSSPSNEQAEFHGIHNSYFFQYQQSQDEHLPILLSDYHVFLAFLKLTLLQSNDLHPQLLQYFVNFNLLQCKQYWKLFIEQDLINANFQRDVIFFSLKLFTLVIEKLKHRQDPLLILQTYLIKIQKVLTLEQSLELFKHQQCIDLNQQQLLKKKLLCSLLLYSFLIQKTINQKQKYDIFQQFVKFNIGNRIQELIRKYKIKNKMSMKRSPLNKTPEKYSKSSISKQTTHTHNTSQINSNLYFCHFKNAMYMGGIKAFQKNGRGLLLHDNGTNVISSYYNDLLHGHNIFFTNYCFLSAEYSKNKLSQAVYRTDGFLLVAFYNHDGQLDGKTILLNYITKSILYCTFKKGQMIAKQDQADFTVINRVFDLNQIDFLIGKKHAKALNYSFQRENNLSFQKIGTKLIAGYEKHGLVNGLAFSYTVKSTANNQIVSTPKNQDSFELAIIQRGYYINGQLNGFGQKIFKNGNSYIGQFKCDVFQGNGILKNNIKKNWVSGFFEGGNLIDLLQYNHEGGEKKYDKIIQAFHQKRSNWINNQISLINWEFFDEQIQKIIGTNPNTQVRTLQQRKIDVLRKIQENFICQNNEAAYPSTTLRQIQQYNGLKNTANSDKQSIRKFVRNFIPEGENIVNQKLYSKQREKQKEPQSKQFMSNKRKSELINQSRKSKVNIRKSRIFENTGGVSPSKSVDSFLKVQRVSVKNQQDRPKLLKNKSLFDVSQHNKRANKNQLRPQQGNRSPRMKNSSVIYTQKTSPERQHDSKKIIGKSRIFSYLNSQEDDITPKFNYNQNQIPKSTKHKFQEGN